MSDLLRVATAGSVDDGKSTLIGRLLYDSQSIHLDQLAAIEDASRRRGLVATDLALLTDGLRAEREQGITIDVAYRYFATEKRSFVLADTPGHVQYTRNMVTGASLADVAIVLIDAEQGVVEQTRRHLAIATLLGVPHVVLAVNKMDRVNYQETTFDAIVAEVDALASALDATTTTAIPISALHGDNVVHSSAAMPWYAGPVLLEHLETVEIRHENTDIAARMPVQLVVRGDGYRGYAGRLVAGDMTVGSEVVVLPSGHSTTIAGIDTADGPLERALAGQSIVLRFDDQLDVARGDVVVAREPVAKPVVARSMQGQVCVVADRPLRVGARVRVRAGTREARATLTDIHARLDVATLQRGIATELAANDLGEVNMRLAEPLVVDEYQKCRHTGSFLILDELDGNTLAAGMVTRMCQ